MKWFPILYFYFILLLQVYFYFCIWTLIQVESNGNFHSKPQWILNKEDDHGPCKSRCNGSTLDQLKQHGNQRIPCRSHTNFGFMYKFSSIDSRTLRMFFFLDGNVTSFFLIPNFCNVIKIRQCWRAIMDGMLNYLM